MAEHGRPPQHGKGRDIFERLYAVRLDRLRESEECRQILGPLDTRGLLAAGVQRQLATGERETLKYQDNAAVEQGQMFILDGQKLIVAELGELFVGDHGRPDRRLRVVYDNGTESDLLLRSLQRALNKDKASRRITKADYGPLFADIATEDDLPSGTIYVLRSNSNAPVIMEHRAVIHKIGVTGGDVKRSQVRPREWFLVPLDVIEEAVEKIRTGTIDQFRYDPTTASLTRL